MATDHIPSGHILRFHIFTVLFLFLAFQASAAEQFFLKQTILEGESISYTVAGYQYDVTLRTVFDSQRKAVFEVNGEKTDALGEGEMYRFSDGASIQARDIMPQESGEGNDLVQFNFFPASHPTTGVKAVKTINAYDDEIKESVNTTPPTSGIVAEEYKNQEQSNASESGLVELTAEKAEKKLEQSVFQRFLEWIKRLFV